jgi:hypothetical protein
MNEYKQWDLPTLVEYGKTLKSKIDEAMVHSRTLHGMELLTATSVIINALHVLSIIRKEYKSRI